MDKVLLNGLEFYGFHGVFPEEQRLGQRFLVDLTLGANLQKAGETDDLNFTIHYGHVYEKVKEIVEGEPFKLIEALAEKISSEILQHFPLVCTCTVKVTKPNPPIVGHYNSVAVEITRRTK